ncbi:MAG: valine--tRNA ligase [Chloroflexi bacterium]|nr:valine--tRNA ligase [Chloroflexota bacterium]
MTVVSEKRDEMPRAYDPSQVEQRLYDFWLAQGCFTPKIDPGKKPFVIIMPPPNITGQLHLGHALTATLEDIMIRWHRMLGEPTLWLPGTDHASIATQFVVEQMLAAEGLTRFDLGRERFLERTWDWANKYRHRITEQHKRLGVSCDWSRERFTMDPVPSRAVRTTFLRLYNKGLIYRGERIINWCPRCCTALSDLEVEHEELHSHLWYVRYPLSENGTPAAFITVATTRPETILGDTAVAVNPGDERFQGLVGRKAILPAVNREIPIIADEAVDPAFGAGAVKITPSHDPVDFEVAQRHNLPFINILNPDGTMNENAGPYVGMERFQCRKAILADLERDGLLVKTDDYVHSVGHCQRCGTIVEPLVSKQWFVKITPLAIPAIDAVIDGRIRFVPERFTKVYLNWMENIRDWCISRQLWWGHRIPVWYCGDCGELTVAIEDPSACARCGSINISQDPDVLDTWFSSGLWPHSTLGWPDDTEDLRYFYPTSVMETAYDILFFWVARMIMMGLENTGRIPFHTVYLHGLIRDEKGEKMSKSRGNVVDPVDLQETYGTDALRFALSTGSTPGNDMKLSRTRLEAGRNFANKLWNASRFIISNLDAAAGPISETAGKLNVQDAWIMSRLNHTIADVDRLMKDFQFGEAGRQIHDFLWGEFCDWYIEMAKIRLRARDEAPLAVLSRVLESSLRLLHPFMPFITEEIWQSLAERLGRREAATLALAPYPVAEEAAFDDGAEREMRLVIDIVRAIRNARAEFNIEPAKPVQAIVVASEAAPGISAQAEAIGILARAKPLDIHSRLSEKPPRAYFTLAGTAEVYLPVAGLVDIAAERERLAKERAELLDTMARLDAKLANESFTSRAPAQVVERERQRLGEQQEKLSKLGQRLALLE